jgi:hypothetical protein
MQRAPGSTQGATIKQRISSSDYANIRNDEEEVIRRRLEVAVPLFVDLVVHMLVRVRIPLDWLAISTDVLGHVDRRGGVGDPDDDGFVVGGARCGCY